jgi:hydroxyacylglutathione hydrolase
LRRNGSDAVQIIDVRNPDEWSKGHLPGARHIPLAALPDRLSELDRSTPIVLHCQGGGRSAIAASFLQSKGIANVSNLTGGYQGWLAAGHDVESGKPEPRARSRRKR